MTIVTLLLLLCTGLATYLAFRDSRVFERYAFKPREILAYKEYDRILSSGFLHADWMHFGMNAFSLYAFGPGIEEIYGYKILLLIYFGSIVGGNLLALFFHRHHEYTAIGASGGVCGVIFATLFLVPGSQVVVFPIPIGIPAWIYALAFLLYSYFGMRNQKDYVGHDAHFGGAIFGVVLAFITFPQVVMTQKYLLLCVLSLSSGLLWFLIKNPFVSAGSVFSFGEEKHRSNIRYHRYDELKETNKTREEVDKILEKISKRGFGSLSSAEKTKLDSYSKSKRC